MPRDHLQSSSEIIKSPNFPFPYDLQHISLHVVMSGLNDLDIMLCTVVIAIGSKQDICLRATCCQESPCIADCAGNRAALEFFRHRL
jgi:hypothetical protein